MGFVYRIVPHTNRLMRILTLAAVVALIPLSSRAQSAADTVHVDITGLRSTTGHVFCSLYSTAADFPGNASKALANAKVDIKTDKTASCDFVGIKPGRYAIAVMHDENDNGKMDTKEFGIPAEGVGASNDAKGSFGPPQFDDAAFAFAGKRLNLKVKIDYM